MISEAFRVTKPGSRSVFTIWANEEKSLHFTATKVIVQRYKPDYIPPITENFNLWNDKGAQLKKDFESAGFTNIKMWEQPNNVYSGDSGEDYMKAMGDNMLRFMMKASGLSSDQFDKLR